MRHGEAVTSPASGSHSELLRTLPVRPTQRSSITASEQRAKTRAAGGSSRLQVSCVAILQNPFWSTVIGVFHETCFLHTQWRPVRVSASLQNVEARVAQAPGFLPSFPSDTLVRPSTLPLWASLRNTGPRAQSVSLFL